MKRRAPFIAILLLSLAGLACKTVERMVFPESPPANAAADPAASPPEAPSSTPEATPDTCPNGDCIEACLKELGAIASHPHGSSRQSALGARPSQSADWHTLVIYPVQGDELGQGQPQAVPSRFEQYADDSESHQRIWRFYATIVPPDQRESLDEFHIFSDGRDEILAAVEQSYEDPNKWNLMVDILDAGNPEELTFTLVHEYAHLLTLGPDQVPPSEAIFDNPESERIYEDEAEACSTYFPGEGCARRDSYLNRFVETFWLDFYDEWVDITYIEDEDKYYEELDDFYNKYEDQFVTDYAATSPEEDIAESFSFFVLSPRPSGNSIADQKVLFFYQFPELVERRLQMIDSICGYR